MPTTLDASEDALGQPVELGRISRELKKLWKSELGATTRASLINFAVYCEGAEAMRVNTELLNEFTRHHACRAILIGCEPQSDDENVRAWINAHCHLSREGAKQVCCEQVTFAFSGRTKSRIANVLFANLDSDLPLYLWWQGEFSETIDEALWAWVDRLIFDSQSWRNPREQFSILRSSLDRARADLILCDLNWTRSLHLRQALAQMFDHSENRAVLEDLESVTIAHASEFRSTALLLAGWFAAQLGLEPGARRSRDAIEFTTTGGRFVAFHFREETGRSISRCELVSPSGSVQVQRDLAGDFFRVEVRLPGDRIYHHLLPAGSNATTDLLLEEIGGAGRHRVYLKALAAAEEVL